MSNHDIDLLDALLRTDLPSFIAKDGYTVVPGQAFLGNWHIEAIAWELERCRTGEITNLIITMPPRYLKSICASVALPGWILGHDPTARLICASYSIELAAKHSRDCRVVMESDWYRRIFPRTRIATGKNSELEFETSERGFRLTASVGGTLTGRGGNYLIIDDSLKPADAYSEPQREKVNQWMDQTVVTRMDDKRSGVKIIIQQRLHAHDLVGHLLDKKSGNWSHLDLPAIADRPQRIQIGRNLFHARDICDVLHPAREPLWKLMEIKAEMGSPAYSAQYQQAPMPPEGNIVDPRWLVAIEHHQLPLKFDRIVQSWDTATKVNELADYSACVTLGQLEKRIYILNVLRKRLNYPDLKRVVKQQADPFKPDVILIEDRSSGTQLLQEFRHEGLESVRDYVPKDDKRMRLVAQTATLENGFVFVLKDAPWLQDFLDELAIFPNGRHDDQVDALSQALDWIKETGREPSIITFYKQQAAARLHPPKPVSNQKWRPPDNERPSHFYTMEGRVVTPDDDGNFLFSEEEGGGCSGWKKVD